MVNYNRMEEVPRAFGPLEPIGPARSERTRKAPRAERPRRASYAARNTLLGAAAFVVVGGALGAYFRTDFTEEPAIGGPIGTPVEPADGGEGVDILVAEGPPTPSALPEEAMPIDVSGIVSMTPAPAPAPVEMLPAPAPAPVVRAQPVQAEPPSRFEAARRTLARMLPSRAEPEPRRVVAAAPRPVARTVERPRPAPVQAGPQLYARNDVAPPAPVRIVPAPAPIVIARADPPRAVRVSEAPAAPDCSALRSAGERTVCQNAELGALDRRLAAEFERALAAGHDRAALHLDQDSWLARREAAAPDPRAVAEAYERRIRQLRSMY